MFCFVLIQTLKKSKLIYLIIYFSNLIILRKHLKKEKVLEHISLHFDKKYSNVIFFKIIYFRKKYSQHKLPC